jgi:hypothetical protein
VISAPQQHEVGVELGGGDLAQVGNPLTTHQRAEDQRVEQPTLRLPQSFHRERFHHPRTTKRVNLNR